MTTVFSGGGPATEGRDRTMRAVRGRREARLTRPLKARLCAIMVWLAAASVGGPAAAEMEVFTTSSGVTIEVPSIGAHESCAQLSETLDLIDQTGYRRGSPDAIRHPDDQRLLSYEESVSERMFDQCGDRQPLGLRRGFLQFSD